jgi:hypothetical protein
LSVSAAEADLAVSTGLMRIGPNYGRETGIEGPPSAKGGSLSRISTELADMLAGRRLAARGRDEGNGRAAIRRERSKTFTIRELFFRGGNHEE